MQNQPTANELVESVREFLKEEILPDLDDPRARFRTLVAMNALSILEREIAQEEGLLQTELVRLGRLLGRDEAAPGSLEKLKARVTELNRDLAQRIRRAETPEGALESLKLTTRDKLVVASPRFLERYEA